MKIEIEFEEVEQLRKELYLARVESSELREKLNNLSEDKLKQDAVKLSERLFNDYMSAVFNGLGLQSDSWPISFDCDLTHKLGKEWWKSDRLKVNIGATVTSEFKRAFLNIGIITEEQTLSE